MRDNTIRALNEAVVQELTDRGDGVKMDRVDIVPTISCLRNGLKRCVVQVIGKSGRSHRIETIGRDAEYLFQEATRLRTTLDIERDGFNRPLSQPQLSIPTDKMNREK